MRQELDKVKNAAKQKSQTDASNLIDDDYNTQTLGIF